jgi:hypothetical protein
MAAAMAADGHAWWANLTVLDLGGACPCTTPTRPARGSLPLRIQSSPAWPRIGMDRACGAPTGGNHIGCEGARALGASLAQLPQLDTLLVNRGVEIPVRALREGTVARLDFAHTTLQPEDAVLVAAAIRCGAEERVNRLRLSPDNCAWAKVRACVHGGPCLAAGLSMCAGLGGVRFSLGGYIG